MKDVTETQLGHIMLAHPNATVETRDGERFVLIPMYDMDTDRAWIEERKIVRDPDETPQGILPVFNVRKGANFDPGGEVKTGAMGQLFRIIGYTPPEKDKKD